MKIFLISRNCIEHKIQKNYFKIHDSLHYWSLPICEWVIRQIDFLTYGFTVVKISLFFLWKVQMNLKNIWAPLPNLEIRKPFLKIIFKINNFFPLFLDLHLPNVKYVGPQNIMELYVVFVDDAWPNGLKKETKSLYIWFMWHCNVSVEILEVLITNDIEHYHSDQYLKALKMPNYTTIKLLSRSRHRFIKIG